VFEWEDRREEEGADTALKTKTPHVNVGTDSTLHQKKSTTHLRIEKNTNLL
jgi:hypothetical protein